MQVSESISNAARAADRYAVIHPSAVDGTTSSVQGVAQSVAQGVSINDSDISITYTDQYQDVQCGHVNESASPPSFVLDNSYTQCQVPENIIQVSISHTFQPVTPVFRTLFGSSGIPIKSTVSMAEEVRGTS